MRKLVVLLVAMTTLVSCSEEDKTFKMLQTELDSRDYSEGDKVISYTLKEVPTKDEIEFEMIEFYEGHIKKYKTIRGYRKEEGYKDSKRELKRLKTLLEEHPITLEYTIKILTNDGRNITNIVSHRK